MKVLLGIVGDEDGAQIRSLADWLRDDESVPTVATVEATPDPAEMGPVTDAIALVLQPHGADDRRRRSCRGMAWDPRT